MKLICPSIVTFRCSPHSNAGMMGLSSFKLHGKLRPFHGGSYTIAHCTQCRLFLLGDTIHPTISFKLLIQHQKCNVFLLSTHQIDQYAQSKLFRKRNSRENIGYSPCHFLHFIGTSCSCTHITLHGLFQTTRTFKNPKYINFS